MKIHFIGVGGIGISALAQHYLEKGDQISGSDLIDSETTELLKNKGVEIFIGKHKKRNLPQDTNLVIYSPAIKNKNPELKKARENNIKVKSYPEALGDLTKKYYTIAVAGTHGKSTTTAIVGLILTEAGFDPTVILGTKLKEFGNTNFREGKSKYLVIEADEWRASFLNYHPRIVILTNIEKEHLDYYKNLNQILKSFRQFIKNLPKDGTLIVNKKDKNVSDLLSSLSKSDFKIKKYPQSKKDIKKIKEILKIPGKHNIYNSSAALEVARTLKIPDKTSLKALSDYKGAWRRFEISERELNGKEIKIINDYAHHPTEIRKTIIACKEKFPNSKIWTVFQPHQYQRTFYLFDDFVKAFDKADEIILTKIYTVAGREKKEVSEKVNSQQLTREIKKRGKNCHFIKNFKKIPQFLKNKIESGDTILIMGAGDIYRIVEKF